MGQINYKVSLFKKVISYFKPITLEQTGSAYNPILNVILDRGELQLCTEDAIYSYGNRYYNFRDAFDLIDFNHLKISDVLLLGLGLGSIPKMLEQKFNQNCHYTAIDVDEEVIRLAHKYCIADLKSSVDYFPCDALAFAEYNNCKYDLVAMDIFQGCDVPLKFQSIEFLESLKEMLGENGLLIYNRLALDDKDKIANNIFYNNFKQVFPTGCYKDIRFNRMFFNRKDFFK